MSDDIGTLKDSTVDAAVAPGQTLLNIYGDGYSHDDPAKAGAELSQDREQWEHWWCVTRPHSNSTFGETEYIVKRIGADDVVGTQSRCIEITKAVRDELARDLDEGEVVLFTGGGTKIAMIDMRPNGDITLHNEDGAAAITAFFDANTGNFDITTTGNLRSGAAAADSPFARYNELNTLYTTAVTGIKAAFDAHVHEYLNMGVAAATSLPLTFAPPGGITLPGAVVKVFPAWDANAASSTGRTD